MRANAIFPATDKFNDKFRNLRIWAHETKLQAFTIRLQSIKDSSRSGLRDDSETLGFILVVLMTL